MNCNKIRYKSHKSENIYLLRIVYVIFLWFQANFNFDTHFKYLFYTSNNLY